ncbi:MAG: hypothetical protein IKW92_09785 [Firmicutes bacterium]|nr:hypothetical protein [Bacillota bacterium]
MADPNELKELQDLYEELQKTAQKTPEYEAFLTALKALNDKMSVLYTKDAYGRIPLVRQEEKDELLALHRTLGEKAEGFLADTGGMAKQTVGTVKKLAGLNNAFHSATKNYDPAKKKALHTIHEEARTPVIDTRNQQLKAQLGGAQNRRQPLTFLDPAGKEISGVFIPEKYENGAKNILDAFTKGDAFQKARTANGKRTMMEIVNHFKELSDDNGKDPFETAKYMVRMAERGTDPPKFTAKSIAKYINNTNLHYALRGSTIQTEIGQNALSSLANTLNANYQSMIMNADAKIPAGARIDTRNAAMSSVAELLDVPDLVARAKPMQLIDEKGKIVNGTFMMAAEGIDTNNIPKEASNYGLSAANGTNGNAFKQIADLQVLDYICGNIDRHAANFFMKFDKKGKLIGVQGIDNDCSGGLVVPKHGKGHNRMVGTKEMQVISQSMYTKLKNMTPEQLKFALRGFGVSEEEMDAHVARVNQIIDAADKNIDYYREHPTTKPVAGRLMIVPDDQFRKLKLADLAAYKMLNYQGQQVPVATNLFAHVKDNLQEMHAMYEEQEAERQKEHKEFETMKSEVAIGEDNRANPGAIRRQQQKADKLYNEMDKRTNFWKFFWKSSKKYEDMETAMKNYKNYQKELLTRLELAQDPNYTGKSKNANRNFDREAVVSKEDLEKLQELGQKVYDTAKIYTDGKAAKNVDDMGSYERKRFEIGNMSKAFGKQAKKPLTVEELKTIAANEKLAQENEERTAGNKKEAEDRKKGPAPQA